MFYGPMAAKMVAENDPLWGFRPLGDSLRQGDLLFGNLETPISALRQHEPDARDCYWTPPMVGKALKDYGFDIINLANNHIYDFGIEGVECTLSELKEAELPYCGIGHTTDEAASPAIVHSRNGQKVGFLGYTTANNALDHHHKYVACFPKLSRVEEQVRDLKNRVDIVVVSCHTGAQYNPYPAPETRNLARAAINAGASLFLGHHPHVPQGIERIGNGRAFYSLGDFVAPVHTDETRRTYFTRIRLDGACVVDYEIIPCWITDECQTTLVEGEMRAQIHHNIVTLSSAISEGHSDDLHFQIAQSRFVSQYMRSWLDELKFGGPMFIWRKIRTLRRYHIQLMVRTLADQIHNMKSLYTNSKASQNHD